MPVYRYRARGRDQRPRHGVVEARDRQDATYRLTGRGWQIEDIQTARLPARTAAPTTMRRSQHLLVVLVLILIGCLALGYWLDPFAWRSALGLP